MVITVDMSIIVRKTDGVRCMIEIVITNNIRHKSKGHLCGISHS